MLEHHAKALTKAQARLLEQQPDLIAILVGGSIAKKIERPDSDVDLIVVVPDETFARRLAANKVAFLWTDVCDYPKGYVEGRFVGKSFILAAAARGSEPTRHSFTGAFPVYCTDVAIAETLAAIPVYPLADQAEKRQAFLAQFLLNKWFFWREGQRRRDKYLQLRAATDLVLFGCRLILLENKQLFACQKRLVKQTLACPDLPAGFGDKLKAFLDQLNDETMEAFCQAVINFRPWSENDHLSRFLRDVELSWHTRVSAVSEW